MKLDSNTYFSKINFLAGTKSIYIQAIIENNFERRVKNKYKPKNAKVKVLCFIDELKMPRKYEFALNPH